jgi:hypothetical protein
MTIVEVVNHVTAFVLATAPIAVSVGAIGHALVASKYGWVKRVGFVLEGIGTDWRRVSEAFKKPAGK